MLTKDDFIPLLHVSTERPDIYMGVMAYADDPETVVFLVVNEDHNAAVDMPAADLWKVGTRLAEVALKQMGVPSDKALLN